MPEAARATDTRMLAPIVEIDRLVSTSPEPHSVATDGRTVWIGSRATRRIDVMNAETWQKTGEIVPPGMPWGMTFASGALVMTCGETEDDARRVRRFVPETGFEASFVACPEDTGSHLGLYGDRVLLGQWYNKALHLLDENGGVLRTYPAPHGIAGVAVVDHSAYLLGTDDEDEGEYWITRLNLENGAAVDVAVVPFRARSLAWDGSRFWTNHREADRTVTFALPA